MVIQKSKFLPEHRGGRPPTLYSDEEVHKIGHQLIEWTRSTEFKEAVHICEFYLHRDDITPYSWKALCQRQGFLEYYEHARKAMCVQIIKNKNMRDSVCNRYLCFYDRDLHKFEEEGRDKEAQRKKLDLQSSESFKENLSHLTRFFQDMKKV